MTFRDHIKLHLYAALQLLWEGRYPSNDQLSTILENLSCLLPSDTSRISSDIRKLADDIQRIIESTRLLLTEKNADNLLQDFFYNSRIYYKRSKEKAEAEDKKHSHESAY